MYFITNRKMVLGFKGLEFKLDNSTPEIDLTFCRRKGEGKYEEVGSHGLMAGLRDSGAKQVLIYIHGFSNLPEPNIFPRAKKLQELMDGYCDGMVEVVPLIWPCDNDMGVIKDYWDDQMSADASSPAFVRILQKFMEWRDAGDDDKKCFKWMNILAHSMGNRVLVNTMATWRDYYMPQGLPPIFRNIFMVAADVENEILEKGEDGKNVCDAARNVVVYHANDDLAMPASKISNVVNRIASRRLGMFGPEEMSKVPSNVHVVDCDNFNNTYDKPVGHAYFLEDNKGKPGAAFLHIASCIKTGRVRHEGGRKIILSLNTGN